MTSNEEGNEASPLSTLLDETMMYMHESRGQDFPIQQSPFGTTATPSQGSPLHDGPDAFSFAKYSEFSSATPSMSDGLPQFAYPPGPGPGAPQLSDHGQSSQQSQSAQQTPSAQQSPPTQQRPQVFSPETPQFGETPQGFEPRFGGNKQKNIPYALGQRPIFQQKRDRSPDASASSETPTALPPPRHVPPRKRSKDSVTSIHSPDTPQVNVDQAQPPQPTPPRRLEISRSKEVKSRACDECRQRKTACYYLKGLDSRCFRCQMDGLDCTFDSSDKLKQQAKPLAPKPPKTGQTLVTGTGPIEDYSALPGRSLLKKTLSLQYPRSSFVVGEYGLWDPRVLKSVPLDKSGQNKVATNLLLRRVAKDCLFVVKTEGGAQEWTRACDEIERVVAPYGRMLVNCYFLWFHQNYPVLHEGIFIEKFTRTHRELTPALLGAVYFLALQYWYKSPELSTLTRPSHMAPMLYQLSLDAFFKMSGGASLSLIQAGLLLLQCSPCDGRHLSLASVLNTMAYRLALNKKCVHWKLPKWEINLRARIAWAVFSQSTWVSLVDSLPPLIGDRSWYLTPLSSELFESGGMAKPNTWLFSSLMNLSPIVRDVHLIRELPPPVSEADKDKDNEETGAAASVAPTLVAQPLTVPGDMTEVLDAIKPVQMKLKDWWHSLPQSVTTMTSTETNLSLHLAYIAAESSLHHSIIRYLSAFQSAGYTVSSTLVTVCRSSAKDRLEAALTIVDAITPQSLHDYWYFVSSYQFAIIGLLGALMYTTSEDEDEAKWYRSQLLSYIQQLEALSEFEIMASAVQILRSSIAGVPGLAA